MNTQETECRYCDASIEAPFVNGDDEPFCNEDCSTSFENADDRVKAFASFEGCSVQDAEGYVSSYDEQTFDIGNRSYLCVTDSEADELWDADLENYIEECILHELPEQYRQYFDSEGWKDDARMDGRAHSLNRYDGGEEEIEYNGTDFYIYRTN